METDYWVKVLDRLLSVTLYLSKNNLAFRGSSDKFYTQSNGNFLSLVELLGKYDDVTKELLLKTLSREKTVHYCSHSIQNELINLMANKVLETIIDRLRAAKYYSVILDCTPDVSHQEQLSFTLRFVNIKKKIEVKEHFIGFKTVESSTGLSLTDLLLNTLAEKNIPFQDCRGQGYDNGANMKGQKKGVQARVLSMNPRATFVPCNCHSLNLVVSDAASCSINSITVFGVLQRIYVLFSSSVNRWKILTDNIKGLTVKPLSDTRWESRINSVKVVRFQTEQIYNALIKLSEVENIDAGTRHEAVSLADQLTDFKFLISLVVWYDILFQVNLVSKSMQAKAIDLINGFNMLKSALEFIKNYRDQFDQILVKAKAIADELGVDSEIKVVRKRIKKKHFDYERSDDTDHRTVLEKFKHEFFYTLIDVVTTSLTDRFEILKIHVDLWNFLYDLKNAPENENDLLKHCMDLHNHLKDGSDSDIDGVELCTEIVNIKQLLISCLDVSSPLNILQYIFDYELQDIFPNLWIALRLLLTLPVTVASGERSFSKLKLIKTYLRSTMANERLVSLSVLSIENEIAAEIDFSTIIRSFAERKSRKVLIDNKFK
ncbi:zinc finger MYM-type protein 1-like [Melanaphis sacchari]|nr:zinc finger MYM-type protein 1-like [Melanaphis sacchari]